MTWRNPSTEAALAWVSEILPAVGLALSVTAMIGAMQLMPLGEGLLLVRVGDEDPRSALMTAAKAGAALVSIPAPGFAVVYGDAARVRKAVGLAVTWKGNALCASIP